MTLKPGTQLGPYEIVAPIGAGGMGEVYRARDPRVGREIAIKVSSEQFTDRFEREIRAVAALNHSNICTLYDVGPDYLVMELVEGPTLAERIKQGAIPLEESLEIARQIADALEAAHEKGIVHRDLKPANIKIKPDGAVKVLDFGLAKVGGTPVVSSENSPTLSVAQTAAGVILGTAAYMSPEQAKGKIVDKRADIWAFGVVLYEMLTGKQLFGGETVSDILAAVLKEEPDWDRVPIKVRLLLRRCLEKDPRRRLRDIADAMPLLDSAPEYAPVRRPWLAWGIAAVFVLTTLAISQLYFRQKPPAAEPVCFEIPPGLNLDWSSPFAISPDGRHLAFAALGSDAVVRLWIRDLNSLETRSLPGTESRHIPPFFWSSDSCFIAFGSERKLKKADITGNGTQTICDITSDAVTGSWSPDGIIIFGGKQGIWRVSASGGVPALLTKPDSACHIIGHHSIAILPDNRHFLYYQRSDLPENCGIYIGSLDSKPDEQSLKPLLAGIFRGDYAPSQDSGPSQILFVRDQTLFSQGLDEKRLELVGQPAPVVGHVGTYANIGLLSASTNGVLAYLGSSKEKEGETQISWFDRQGKPQGAWEKPGLYRQIALSRDGRRAAVGSPKSGQNLGNNIDLWLIDFAGGTNTRFTFGQGNNDLAVWSPDGRNIIFNSDRDGVNNLYRKVADGTRDEEALLKSSYGKVPTSWSRDGRFLLYTAFDPKTNADLCLLPLEGDRKEIRIVNREFNEFDGRFSPDMHWIAYTSDESGSYEIYVRGFSPPVSGKWPYAGGKWQVSTAGGSGPRWGKDGKELYYLAPDGEVMAVEVGTGLVFQTKTPKPLFQPPPMPIFGSLPFRAWDVSPDGSKFLFTTSGTETTQTPFTVILNWQARLKK
jgi:eukaryotic-like serine/threonine-protein kinase